MYVKLIRKDGTEAVFGPCSHVEKTIASEDSPVVRSGLDTPGIRLEMRGLPKNQPSELRLPEEGDVIYLMNDRGDTIDTLRWPQRMKEAVAS